MTDTVSDQREISKQKDIANPRVPGNIRDDAPASGKFGQIVRRPLTMQEKIRKNQTKYVICTMVKEGCGFHNCLESKYF
jgi:hypothetical protein